MIQRAIILGGLGQVGTLLGQSLRSSGVAVTLVDAHPHEMSRADDTAFLQADVVRCGPELLSELRNADCVCVCLPEKIALEAVSRIGDAMLQGALWVDTLSVKSDIVRALEPHVHRLEILSLNPMFAPRLGWKGNAIAAIEVSSGPKSAFVMQLLATWGTRIESLSAAEHDRLTAAIQVATHAAVLLFGSALLGLDYDLEKALRIATPPYRLLLTLLHRIASQNPEVYWDIQAYHPLATTVRSQIGRATQALESAVKTDSFASFKTEFERIAALLESHEQLLAEWTRRAFEQLKQ